MTREEREDAINFLKGYLDEEVYTEKCRNAHEMAIKSLEKEPCEDAINRQIISDYVESHIQEINTGYGDLNKHTNEILRMIVDYIESMPPVTPKPKMGHWIDVESLDSALWHACSECGETEYYATNYCPNCGAKMQEVEEK